MRIAGVDVEDKRPEAMRVIVVLDGKDRADIIRLLGCVTDHLPEANEKSWVEFGPLGMAACEIWEPQ